MFGCSRLGIRICEGWVAGTCGGGVGGRLLLDGSDVVVCYEICRVVDLISGRYSLPMKKQKPYEACRWSAPWQMAPICLGSALRLICVARLLSDLVCLTMHTHVIPLLGLRHMSMYALTRKYEVI